MLKDLFKTIYPLVVIAAVAGLLLGGTYQLIERRLAETVRNEMETALRLAVPSAMSFTAATNGETEYYRAIDAGGSNAGFVFRTSQKGYGGPVVALVGITNGAVLKVIIVETDKETPGLGTRAKDPKWLSQFSGITPEKVPTNRMGFKDNGLDAVTGATITSMAVARDIRSAFLIFRSVTGTNGTNVMNAGKNDVNGRGGR